MNSHIVNKPTHFLRAHWLTSLCVTVSIGFLVWRWADFTYGQTPCPAGVARHAPHEVTHETCPSLGQMNGVKLAIPQHYLLGPKGYKGIDIWNAESYKIRPKTNSFNNELDNFAIKIRLTNFKPIETFKDREDYGSRSSPAGPAPVEKRWIHVGVTATGKDLDFQPSVTGWLKDEVGWGPFIAKPDIFGLKHYVSAQIPTVDDKTWHQTQQWEFFYDSQRWATFISCTNNITPIIHREAKSCHQQFYIAEIPAFVDIDTLYDDADLARWPEIEREVRKVIQSFIVP